MADRVTATDLLRVLSFSFLMVFSGVCFSNSFDEKVAGFYLSTPESEFDARLTIYPVDAGQYKGKLLAVGERFELEARRDRFDIEGTYSSGASTSSRYEVFDFSFRLPEDDQMVLLVEGGEIAIPMVRRVLPNPVGWFVGEFGSVEIKNDGESLSARVVRGSGEITELAGQIQGPDAVFVDHTLTYDLQAAAYYFEGTAVFDEVTKWELSAMMASDPLVIACDTEAGSPFHPTSNGRGKKSTSDIDADEAVTVCQAAADKYAGHPRMQANLGRALHVRAINNEVHSFDEAYPYFEAAAKQDDPVGLFYMGFYVKRGFGGPEDLELSAEYYQRSASLGYPAAISNLGRAYERGEGVAEDHKRALELYKEAYESGSALAAFNLASLYLNGKGTTVDWETARSWYQKADERGVKDASPILQQMAQLSRCEKLRRDVPVARVTRCFETLLVDFPDHPFVLDKFEMVLRRYYSVIEDAIYQGDQKDLDAAGRLLSDLAERLGDDPAYGALEARLESRVVREREELKRKEKLQELKQQHKSLASVIQNKIKEIGWLEAVFLHYAEAVGVQEKDSPAIIAKKIQAQKRLIELLDRGQDYYREILQESHDHGTAIMIPHEEFVPDMENQYGFISEYYTRATRPRYSYPLQQTLKKIEWDQVGGSGGTKEFDNALKEFEEFWAMYADENRKVYFARALLNNFESWGRSERFYSLGDLIFPELYKRKTPAVLEAREIYEATRSKYEALIEWFPREPPDSKPPGYPEWDHLSKGRDDLIKIMVLLSNEYKTQGKDDHWAVKSRVVWDIWEDLPYDWGNIEEYRKRLKKDKRLRNKLRRM